MSSLSTEPIDARIVAPPAPASAIIRSWFTYDPAAPFEVHLTLHDPEGEDAVWTFARELLDPDSTVTTMDIDVTWTADEVIVTVWECRTDHPRQSLSLGYPRTVVEAFAASTYASIPRGREALDFDALIRGLIA